MLKTTQIILAVMMLLCLADMPYGYFQFVRFAALIVFGILAYEASEQKNQNKSILYAALAILFQPFFKISLGREIWNIIDVVVGIGLLISAFQGKEGNTTKP
jgi:hypothetical protein